MIKVGITGGIGSGKSIISKVFSILGVPVYNADIIARFLMDNDWNIIFGLTEKFGDHIYKNNILDRKKLASIIFTDHEALNYVNGLVHPVVGKDTEKWFKSNNNETYVIKEAAIFFESGTNIEMDIMITVVSPLNIRYKRIMERDGLTEEQVRKRMENQLSDEEKINKSDFVIKNDDYNSVVNQVLNIHELISSSKTIKNN